MAAKAPESAPLAKPGRDMDWEDEDEKTTVFDRSDEDSAKALLHAGGTSLNKAAPPPAPAPAAVRAKSAPPPPPTPSAAAAPNVSAAAALARPSMPQSAPAYPAASAPAPAPYAAPPQASAPVYSQPAPATSAPAYSQPQYSQPQASAPVYSQPAPSAPMYSQPYPAPKQGTNKGLVFGGIAAALAVAAGAYFLLGAPKEGSLVVTVAGPGGRAVSGAIVKIGDEVKCQSSPCTIEGLPAGKSQVVFVSAPGYAEAAGQAIKVVGGEETPINVQLAAASAGTGVRVTSKTPGLRLSVDGKDYGPLPQELTDLKPGSHNIEVGGNPLFAPFTKKVEVPPDEIVTVEPTLTFIKGEITVELGDNAKGAKIWLKGDGDDKALHRLNLPQTITIPADKQMTLVAERTGFDTYERTISLSADEPSKTYVISLSKPGAASSSGSSASTSTSSKPTTTTASPTTSATPASGAKLNINSIPMSNVILDGKPLGATPRMGVAVSPGNHTVVFVHPEHGRKVQQVSVGAGETKTAVVRFP